MRQITMLLVTGVVAAWGQARASYTLAGQVKSGAVDMVGARVIVTRLSDSADDRVRMQKAVLVDERGNYEVTGLVAGRYRVCAELPGSVYLDPCEWDAKPPIVAVDGRGVNRQNLQMERGAVLLIRVEDGSGVVREAPGRWEAGVKNGRGDWVMARDQGNRGRERWYLVAVPKGREAKVVMRGNGRVEKADGARLGPGESVGVAVGLGESEKEVRLAVRR